MIRVFIAYLVACVALFALQDILLFPVIRVNPFAARKVAVPPDTIESFMVKTADGTELNVWTTWGKLPLPVSPYVGLIFHGNGETVAQRNFLPFFARHSIPAFTFDYRGYGASTGWISEKHLLEDSEAVWQAVQQKTGVDAAHLVILGNSIGTAPASYLASKVSPRALILLAGYFSLPELINDMALYRPFAWLLRYQLQTGAYLSQLKAHCLIAAHGRRDTIINFRHLDLLRAAVDRAHITNTIFIENDVASHNDLYYAIETGLDVELDRCLK